MGIIKKGAEVAFKKTIKMLIYGQAGMGKSTLAISAPKPLYIDFDGSNQRLAKEHRDNLDIVPVQDWADIKQLFTEEVEEIKVYDTIVVDTIGKMMDFIISFKCGTRQPQIRDWGAINQEFTWFTRTLTQLNKHIVFVAHRDSRKEGDTTVFVPALREKSYNSIVTELDALGYLEMRNDRGAVKRTITFDPTDRNDGKNTCNLPPIMEIPTIIKNGKITGENDFVTTKIINPYISSLEAKEAVSKEYAELIRKHKEQIANITNVDEANMFVDLMKDVKHIGNSKVVIGKEFTARVAELGLVYNKETKCYEVA